jgi:hypothetical protein
MEGFGVVEPFHAGETHNLTDGARFCFFALRYETWPLFYFPGQATAS